MKWDSWVRVGSTQLQIGDRVRLELPGALLYWEGTVDAFDDRGRDGIRVEVLWDDSGRKSYRRHTSAGGYKPGYQDFEVRQRNGLDVVFDYLDQH